MSHAFVLLKRCGSFVIDVLIGMIVLAILPAIELSAGIHLNVDLDVNGEVM